MAAPAYVTAYTGQTDAGGIWGYGPFTAGGSVGDIIILQVLQDGTTSGAVALTGVGTSVSNLAGTGSSITFIGEFAGGGCIQYLWIGRIANQTINSLSFAGSNSTSEDVYVRAYQFSDVNTGTTLADVLEQGTLVDYRAASVADNDIGRFDSARRHAASFVATGHTILRCYATLRSQGSPADNLTVEVQTNSGGVPSGTVLASTSISGATLTGTPTEYEFEFDCAVSAATTYWLVIGRSGSIDSSNYYQWRASSVSAPNGAIDNAGTWGADAIDRTLGVFLASTTPSTTSGTGTDIADAGVTTTGPDRLALQFVGVDDDNAVGDFTGETGGDWTEAVAEYAEASGTDGCIQLQIARAWDSSPQQLNISAGSDIWGDSSADLFAGQSFTPVNNETLYEVTLWLRKYGTPTDNITVAIYSDSGDHPNSSLASATINGSTLTTSADSYKVSFASPPSLTASTKYWIVLTRDSADAGNYYGWYGANGNPYASHGFGDSSTAAGIAESATFDAAFALGSSSNTGGTIDGGSYTMAASDGWGVVGFALLPEVTEAVYVPRYAFTNFQGPGVF